MPTYRQALVLSEDFGTEISFVYWHRYCSPTIRLSGWRFLIMKWLRRGKQGGKPYKYSVKKSIDRNFNNLRNKA